jgi:hypothetical protein
MHVTEIYEKYSAWPLANTVNGEVLKFKIIKNNAVFYFHSLILM